MDQRAVVAPETDPDTDWWWDALRDDRILVPHCSSCERHFFPPTPTCPHCGSADVGHSEAAGTGSVYSWIVVHVALDPAFGGDTPYTVAAVHLTEGPRMFGRIANGPLEDGQPVRLVPYRVDGVTLLGFERLDA